MSQIEEARNNIYENYASILVKKLRELPDNKTLVIAGMVNLLESFCIKLFF